MKSIKIQALTAAVLLSAAAAAQADITTYTSQAAFNAAVGNRGVDTFNDLSIDLLPESLSRTAGSYSYTASAPGSQLYGAGGAGDGWLSTNRATDTILFNGFMPGVTAAGGFFFGSDIAGQWVEGSTVIVHASDGVDSADFTISNSGVTSFVGFSSTRGLVSLSMESVSATGPIWNTANNFTLGQVQAVPEPAEYAMLLAGLLSLGWAARRRRG